MESDDTDGNESLYAACSSVSSGRSSSASSSGGSLQSADSCWRCGGGHYREVDSYYWARTGCSAAKLFYRHLFGPRPRDVIVSSSAHTQTRSGWTSSLRWALVLLAACSLSSLAACIAVTEIKQPFFQADMWTESLLQPPQADRPSWTQWIPVAQYSWGEEQTGNGLTHQKIIYRSRWKRTFATCRLALEHLGFVIREDCVAQDGRAKCSPVQRALSLRKGSLSRANQQHRQSMARLHVLEDGEYHVSTQITGTAWQAPVPTLLRVVVARVMAKSGYVSMTSTYSLTGTEGDSGAPAATQKGTFSVYTAVSVPLIAGEELVAHVVCVEKPDCVVDVNSTASYLTLERLH